MPGAGPVRCPPSCGGGLCGAQQVREPFGGRVGLQGDLRGHGQRHRQQHAHRPENPSPQHQGEKHDQRGKPQALPHESRLDHIAHADIDRGVSGRRQECVGGPELHERQQHRGNGSDYRPDGGHEVEQESEQAPEYGEVDAEYREIARDDEARDEAHGGLDGEIAVHVFREAGEIRHGTVGIAQHVAQLARETGRFGENEDHRQQDEEAVREHPAKSGHGVARQGEGLARIEVIDQEVRESSIPKPWSQLIASVNSAVRRSW